MLIGHGKEFLKLMFQALAQYQGKWMSDWLSVQQSN